MKNRAPILFIPYTKQSECEPFQKETRSIYFHIPFCNRKCSFCSIHTGQCDNNIMKTYVKAMLCELQKYKELCRVYEIDSVHFGGGTPSLLQTEQIREAISAIEDIVQCENVEIVFEAHPESLSLEKIDLLSQLPKSTLNVGIQTFSSKLLSHVNRPLNRESMIKHLQYAKAKRFFALGVDIIVGLPHSSIMSALDDLRLAMDLGVDDISLYPLRIEKGSTLYRERNMGTTTEAEMLEIMEASRHLLSSAGYTARSAYRWTNKIEDAYLYSMKQMHGGEWIGIGAGAVTYLDQTVYMNHSNVNDYITHARSNRIVHASSEKQSMTSQIIWELSFMMREGYLNKEYIHMKYGSLLMPGLEQLLNRICDVGYASYADEGIIALTARGIIHLDGIEQIIREVLVKEYEPI